MSDRSGQSDTDNSFAGISFEGVNAVPPQSGENGDTINLADVADVSEQDDVSNAATETMPPLNFASDQTQPFQSFPTAGAAETTPAGAVPNGAVPTGAIPTGDMPSSTPAPAIPVLTMPVEGEAVVAKKRKLPLIITGIVLAVLVVAAIAGFGVVAIASGSLGPSLFAAFLPASFLMGACSPLYAGTQTALMQEQIPPEYLGRVFGLYGTIMAWAMPMGLAAPSVFADLLGAPLWFVGSGATMVLLAMAMLLAPSVRNVGKRDTGRIQ